MNDDNASDALRIQLHRARKAAGLSQDALGERLGISGVQVSRIETGKRGTGAELVRRWMEACGYALESVSVGEPEAARMLAVAIATLDEDQLKAVRLVIQAWPSLPDNIIAAVLAMIGPYEPHD